jgi:hypothetical protein
MDAVVIERIEEEERGAPAELQYPRVRPNRPLTLLTDVYSIHDFYV